MLRKSVLSMRAARTMSTAAAPQEPALTRVRDLPSRCTQRLHGCLTELCWLLFDVVDRCMVV